ncbi:ATP-binding cassette domain-containing protein [Mariprofundus erugo]|uniref:ATP-binding cassette domain-containing protein n=1 Tax=Mariprofundus erugo TaxID=2528639 RepID=A0A5R9GRQ2_9PROT|nr:ATP-binding cassette domain-containing protein [Mariprofundus erugo]TLS68936.1 ATP-binding cassette domain-containing protein [Mariprofundus erugo]
MGDCHATSGDIILVTGKNGCGKSLWLQRMAGLEPFPAGIAADIDGMPLQSWPVRMLFDQWPAMWLGQSVHDEMTFGLGRQPEPAEIMKTLADWGLQEGITARTPPSTLNRLQSVRLILASMNMAGPVLALLDNPTDNLSHDDAADLISDIAGWARKSKTIVVVACNRWQDWQVEATQQWHIHCSDELPQLRGHA